MGACVNSLAFCAVSITIYVFLQSWSALARFDGAENFFCLKYYRTLLRGRFWIGSHVSSDGAYQYHRTRYYVLPTCAYLCLRLRFTMWLKIISIRNLFLPLYDSAIPLSISLPCQLSSYFSFTLSSECSCTRLSFSFLATLCSCLSLPMSVGVFYVDSNFISPFCRLGSNGLEMSSRYEMLPLS